MDEEHTTDKRAPLTLKPSTYQPSKAEQEEEQDMLEWSLDKIRDTFMRPFRAKPDAE